MDNYRSHETEILTGVINLNRDVTESRERRRDERYNPENRNRRPYRDSGNRFADQKPYGNGTVQRDPNGQDASHNDSNGKKNVKENIIRLLNDEEIDDSTKLMAESLFFLANKIEHSTRIIENFTKTMEGVSKIFDEALKREEAKKNA